MPTIDKNLGYSLPATRFFKHFLEFIGILFDIEVFVGDVLFVQQRFRFGAIRAERTGIDDDMRQAALSFFCSDSLHRLEGCEEGFAAGKRSKKRAVLRSEHTLVHIRNRESLLEERLPAGH